MPRNIENIDKSPQKVCDKYCGQQGTNSCKSCCYHENIIIAKVTTTDDDNDSVTVNLDFTTKEFEEYIQHLEDMYEHAFIFYSKRKVTERYYEIYIHY